MKRASKNDQIVANQQLMTYFNNSKSTSMKYSNLIFAFLLCILGISPLYAQESSKLLLRTGTLNMSPNLKEYISSNHTTNNSMSYKLMLFKSTPEDEVKESLKSHGVQFLEYVPDNGFIVKLPNASNMKYLESMGIHGIYDLPKGLKLDYRLIDWNIPQHASVDANKVKVAVIAMNGINIIDYSTELSKEDIAPYEYGLDKRFAYYTLDNSQINDITKKPWVRYIEIIDEPGKPESTEGRSIQRSNLINSHLSNGLSYDGAGVKLLVRDDGLVGPHIDYTGRLYNLTTDATGTHGDGVAGVMGGAGNIDPTVEGGSSAADIYVINYVSNFQDTTLGLHLYDSIMITNSSYSNGCNAGYTSTTQTVDKQIFDNQTLMHVFSAGNSNNNDCGYGAGNQWGNITGGHKMGKNVITVANLFNDGSLVSSSSRGPAHDGRIKPDMAAHGQGQMSTDPNNQYAPFGGTSSAAPSLAGNLGQLLQAYRSLNSGTDPKSSLLKAAAMNSATDLGNAGPDFRYGYGMINTGRAYDVIANNQYLFSTISQSGTNNHTVNVPTGTGQLRIMLYWHDPEGTVSTSKALVNDLDLVVNGTLLPLVLDHTPNATTLNNPAAPAVDHLNNVEQVVVNNPTAGNYAVQISGFQVPSGPQEYVLVYSFIEDDIKVTYPLGGESLIPGNSEIIHWDAYGNAGTFTIEYSTNNGGSWNTIGTAPGNDRNISWTVPSINTGDALIRVSRSSQSDVSDETFNIFPVPQFNVLNNNASSIELNWTAITGANKYYIWRLGTKFMEIVDSSTSSPYILNGLNGGENLWLSVSANSSSITGERANAKNFIFNPTGSCGGCISSISTFPHVESFETGIGLFCQSNSDDIDFTRLSGSTLSNNTGPSGASDGAHYMYVEATNPNFPSKVAILGSPCYDLSWTTSAQLKFDYHMYGSAMGTLHIDVSTNGGQSWSTTPIWSISGNQGNQWLTDSIDFSSYQTSQVSYRFVGTTGSNFTSDIAIDNIEFTIPPEIALPVRISDWRVNWKQADALLEWSTLEELNTSHFEIERSLDNIHFESIAEIASIPNTGKQAYRYIDQNANELPAPKIYYRILQKDKDENSTLSKVLSLNNYDRPINYSIRPNPSDGVFYLNTIEDIRGIQVINSFGQIIKNIESTDKLTRTIDLSGTASGVYFVVLQNKSNQYQRLKIALH